MLNKIVWIVVTVLMISACFTTPTQSVVEAVPFADRLTNEISIDGYSFALPAGWEFRPPGILNPDGIFVTFESGDGISGSIERIPIEVPFDTDWFLDFFASTVFTVEGRVRSMVIDTETMGSVVRFSGERSGVAMNSYLRLETADPYILHLGFRERTELPITDALALLERFRPVAYRSTVRTSPGGLSFYDIDRSWLWLSDYRGGFVLFHNDEAEPIYVVIWPLDDEDRTEIINDGYEVVEPVPLVPKIHGGTGGVTVYRKSDPVLVLFVVYGDAGYVMSVVSGNDRSSGGASSDEATTAALSLRAIRDLIDFALVFPAPGGEK